MSFVLIRATLWATAILLLAVAVRTDFRARIIPNQVVAAIAADGLLLGLMSRPDRIWISLLVALVLLIGLGVVAHFDLIGGGDSKLIAAVTLLVPPEHIAALLLAIALAGGVVSAAYLAAFYALPRTRNTKTIVTGNWRGKLTQFLRRERRRILRATSVPYSVAVLGGLGIVTMSEFVRCYSATSCSP